MGARVREAKVNSRAVSEKPTARPCLARQASRFRRRMLHKYREAAGAKVASGHPVRGCPGDLTQPLTRVGTSIGWRVRQRYSTVTLLARLRG